MARIRKRGSSYPVSYTHLDSPSLVVLADGVGPGAEDTVDRVLFVLLLLMLHGTILPAGQTAVLGCDAVAVLGLTPTGRQEIPSAVLAQAWRVDMMHPVQQVKAVKLHRPGHRVPGAGAGTEQ